MKTAKNTYNKNITYIIIPQNTLFFPVKMIKCFRGGAMYRKLSDYLIEKFGCKVYKLAISGGMTCPVRDGKISTKGCIFCSNDGSGTFCEKSTDDIYLQIEKAKLRISGKIKDGKYIAYFQDFTNTYAPVDYLKKIFYKAINHPEIVALSIATRPDCLGKDVLKLLEELNKIKPVWVELGLQTIHPSTARYIRRGYELDVFETAVKNLKEIGITVITHIILGLPFETKEMMYQTVKYLGKIGIDGVKLQLLHVLKNTDLAHEYEKGIFETLTPEEYIEILENCIELLPPEVVIHRLTGDGAKKDLIAPLWSADKKKVLNSINSAFKKDKIMQGKKFN